MKSVIRWSLTGLLFPFVLLGVLTVLVRAGYYIAADLMDALADWVEPDAR